MKSLVFFILAICPYFTNAVVYRISAVQHRLPKEVARHRSLELTRAYKREGLDLLFEEEQLNRFNPKHQPSLRASVGSLNTAEFNRWYDLKGNISVGTPPQKLVVRVDFWYNSDLSVLGPGLNMTRLIRELPAKHTYNSSLSSTCVDLGQTFGYENDKSGFLVNDTVSFDQASFSNVSIAVIDNITYEYSQFYSDPIDGRLGLFPEESIYNVSSSFVSQIVSQLDEPIITYVGENLHSGNGTAQITIGGKDTQNCGSDWAFAPRTISYGYGVNTSSFSVALSNGTVYGNIPLNGTIYISDWFGRPVASNEMFNVFLYGAGAVYNKTSGLFVASCDVSKAANISINLKTNDTTNASILVLTGDDYIHYDKNWNACCVNMKVDIWSPGRQLILGGDFISRRCIAYNAVTDEVGIASKRKSSVLV